MYSDCLTLKGLTLSVFTVGIMQISHVLCQGLQAQAFLTEFDLVQAARCAAGSAENLEGEA